MNDFTESSSLDSVRFEITQKDDTETDLLLLGVLGGVYGFPIVIVAMVVLVLVFGPQMSGLAVTGLVGLIGLVIMIASVAFVITRVREKRTVNLEIGAGGLVLNGERLPLAHTTVVLQRLAFSERSVLAVHNHQTAQQKNLGGLILTAAQHARIQQVLDDARGDAARREGGTVPEALQQLRGRKKQPTA